MIRKAEEKDIKEILPIANKLHLDMPGFVWDNEDFIVRQIRNGEYFVLEDGGIIKGIISLRQLKGKIHIETLAIGHGFTSNGFGKELLAFAKRHAKEKGFALLQAYSFYEYNIKDFYLKHGFTLLEHRGSYQGHPYYCFEIKV